MINNKMDRRQKACAGFLQIAAVLLALLPEIVCSQVTPSHGVVAEVPPQLTAGHHVLRFKQGAYSINGIGHTLNIAFVNAQPVKPRAGNGDDKRGRVPGNADAIDSVLYPDLWPGVSLVMKSKNGLVESFYHVAPGNSSVLRPQERPVDHIRLRYDRPVSLDATGNLVINFSTGQIRESAPVAWQEIEGRRIPVPVAFKILSRFEVGFEVAPFNPAYPLVIDPEITWNTFLGDETSESYARDMAVDTAGNIYVIGVGKGTWGSPVTPIGDSPYTLAYVAKLDNGGNLVWNTFFGTAGGRDEGYSVALDSVGRLYIAGVFGEPWNGPVEGSFGGNDAFVARLDSQTGEVVWRTFVGSTGNDMGLAILPDEAGSVYLKGRSDTPWGDPINAHAGAWDIFIAKLYAQTGSLQWNTFIGSSGNEDPYTGAFRDADDHGLAIDSEGHLYVSGTSDLGWGTASNPPAPVTPHTAGENQDAFVAKLAADGRLIWHTFIGSESTDFAGPVKVDDSGSVYLVGKSLASWGTPIKDFSGDFDAFVARLDAANGNLTWNTFIGSGWSDTGADIALDQSGDIFVVGEESVTNPPGADNSGGYVAKLNSTGHQAWKTYVGNRGEDLCRAIAADAQDRLYILGDSKNASAWGNTTVNPHSGSSDNFVAQLSPSTQLVINITGIGTGAVVSDPAGIICDDNQCIGSFDAGTLVTLTATPDEGMTFGGWSGFGCFDANSCTVTVDTDRVLRAHFGNPALDADDDGVSNTDEQGPQSNNPGYDGNGDNVPDWQQADVVSLPSADGQNYITLSASDRLPFDRFGASEVEAATNPPGNIDFMLGVFDFFVDTSAPGGTVTLTIQLEEGVRPDTYYKFGPTPDHPEDHWYEFLYDGTTGAEIKDNLITLHFKDGERGDSDLDATNGIIADPSGPGFSPPVIAPSESGGGGGSGGGGCFIYSLKP